MSAMPAVSTRGLSKDFPTGGALTRVLHDIDLDLATGALTMLVGPSGCGKTTLLSIISGILQASAGTVTVYGTEITGLSDREKVAFRRSNLGFIFQQYNLLPALTAVENASIPLVAAGMPLAKACIEAGKVLDRIGMGPHLRKLPAQLSGGQQQRVAIARALVHQPKLLVCDEPTAALDAQTGLAVLELLRDVARAAEQAVLVVTHDSRIFQLADRIVRMSDGRLEPESTQPRSDP